MKILLGREEVDPDKPNDLGQTSLFYAAWYGREGVVNILLTRGDVNSDKQDYFGQTPLLNA